MIPDDDSSYKNLPDARAPTPINVACPTCNARPLEACKRLAKYPDRTTHLGRIYMFNEHVKRIVA